MIAAAFEDAAELPSDIRVFAGIGTNNRGVLYSDGIGLNRLSVAVHKKPKLTNWAEATPLEARKMVVLVILSVLAGMVLGQRFKVFALVPAMGASMLVAITTGVAHADTPSMLALTAIMVGVGIQIGYFLGLGLRHFMVSARAARLRVSWFGGSIPARRPAR